MCCENLISTPNKRQGSNYHQFSYFMSVFITGAHGFIAKHIIVILLKKNYEVIGTVRSKEKGEFISKQFNNCNFKYLVIPDYEAVNAFDFIENYPQITTVIHTATLINIHAPNTWDIIDIAINSTKNILDSINKYGDNINSVVLTSSLASAVRLKDRLPEYNESTWNDIQEEDATNIGLAYAYGKTASEKYAWDYIEKNHQCYTFSTILPSFTMGPQAFDNDVHQPLNTSAEFLDSIVFKNTISMRKANFIDVRDVAKAHIIAFEKHLNQRLILANDEFTIHDIVAIIKNKFPYLEVPSIEPTIEQAEVTRNINNKVSRQTLGFEFIGLQKSVTDAVEQIVRNT